MDQHVWKQMEQRIDLSAVVTLTYYSQLRAMCSFARSSKRGKTCCKIPLNISCASSEEYKI